MQHLDTTQESGHPTPLASFSSGDGSHAKVTERTWGDDVYPGLLPVILARTFCPSILSSLETDTPLAPNMPVWLSDTTTNEDESPGPELLSQ